MQIYVGTSYAQVLHASAAEEAFLREYLTFRQVNFGGHDESRCLLTQSRFFPAGLARRVVAAARERGLEVAQSSRPLAVPRRAHVRDHLFSHQRGALDAIWTHQRGIIQHATGAGKGTIIAQLVGELERPTLVIVTSVQLLKEMYDRIKKVAEVTAGRFGGGYKELKPPVTIATVQSVLKLPKDKLLSFKAVLGDEVHGAASTTYLQAVMACTNAEVRIGFSGTPLSRGDRKTVFIIGAFGEVIHKYMPSEAAQDGIVAKATLRMVPFHQHHVPATGGYVAWEREAIARNKARNALVVRTTLDAPAPRIVFVRTHEHQRLLVEMLRARGEEVVWVNDKTPPGESEKAIRRIAAGDVSTLISTPIFRQGVDIPEIRSVVHASSGKSTIDVIQKIGRGSRRRLADGTTKDDFYVFDIADRECGCRQRHKGCTWAERHTQARRAAYERFGYLVRE